MSESARSRAAGILTIGKIRMLEEAGLAVVEKEFAEVRPAVQWFAVQMEKKLRENDHKKHWSECSVDYLYDRMDQEVVELDRALLEVERTGNGKEEVIFEAADVANFAMMIADNMREDQSKDRRD